MVPVFRLPIPIEVVCAAAEAGAAPSRARHVVWIEQKEQEVRLPAASPPLMVAFDQGSSFLKEVEFKKTTAELAFIAGGGDSDAVARAIAIEQLPDSDDKELARRTLIAVLGSKQYRDLRSSAASGLGKLGGVTGPKYLGACTDPGTGATWLVLEYLKRAMRVYDLEVNRTTRQASAMAEAARWIGQFHAAHENRGDGSRPPSLIRYDADYFRGWASRTHEFAAPLRERFPWLTTVYERRDEWIETLLSAPPTIIPTSNPGSEMESMPATRLNS